VGWRRRRRRSGNGIGIGIRIGIGNIDMSLAAQLVADDTRTCLKCPAATILTAGRPVDVYKQTNK